MFRGQDGFTLTELAIVLLIVALLIGGLLVPLSSQIDLRNTTDTKKALAEIQDALLGFAAANGRLPCPAPATTATGAVGAGLEVTTPGVGCTNLDGVGVLPWATLGVNETDAWGNRYTYRVTTEFARIVPQIVFTGPTCPPPSNPQYAAFALCSQANMNIITSVASNVPAVVISHGKNGAGAYTPQGTQLAIGSDVDEQDNQLTAGGTSMANLNFVSKTPTDTFDDIVTWLSPNVLVNRMITAGKLP